MNSTMELPHLEDILVLIIFLSLFSQTKVTRNSGKLNCIRIEWVTLRKFIICLVFVVSLGRSVVRTSLALWKSALLTINLIEHFD